MPRRLSDLHSTVARLAIPTAMAAGLASATMPASAQDLEQVSFALNWVPVAEHGGFYQAMLDGTYAACGIEVEIIPGGPQVNNRAMMMGGQIDFHMGGDLLQAFNAVAEDVPIVAIAAIFQKNPQILMTHPGRSEGLSDMDDMTVLVDDNAFLSYYQWLIQDFGFTPGQREVYTYNAAPFLVDEDKVMQGYLTSEPYLIELEGGFTPDVWLLADFGFDSYATTIEAMQSTIDERPDATRCFVEGSIIGWYNYLYGDNTAANAEIQRLNPDFTDDKIEFAISQMLEYGVLLSGDAETLGIGAITEEKAGAFFESMVGAGVLDGDLDWQLAFDTQFINQGLGLDLVPDN
ncbi:MAG: ABC transporter substrate-binding protein [Pseudomonadota bacterium]